MSDLLERVYQAFDPAKPATDADIYVNLDEVRGEADVVEKLEKRIRLSAGTTCQLLAGHRGSGKTTELKRLERVLSAGDKRYFVVFVESAADLDLNDVDFPEILIAIMQRLAMELKERKGITLKPGYFSDRFEKLKKFFGTEVEFDKLDLGASFLKLSATMKSSPDAREELRKLLEPDTSNLLHAANDILGEAMLALGKKGYTNIVILVDDLDKIVLRPHKDAGCSTAEHLFANRHAQLKGFSCHTVYTVPLALVYSTLGAKIASSYGTETPVVPMTKIRTRPPGSKAHKPGTDRFRDIIAHRLKHAKTQESEVFGKGVIDRLVVMSGGQPRELMKLVRDALIGGALPVQSGAVARVETEGARAYARQLTEEQTKLLRQVAKSGRIVRNKATDETFRELLDSRAVLQYVNDTEWYGVNPLIDMPKGRPKPKAKPRPTITKKVKAKRKRK